MLHEIRACAPAATASTCRRRRGCLHEGWKPAPRGAATGSACSPA